MKRRIAVMAGTLGGKVLLGLIVIYFVSAACYFCGMYLNLTPSAPRGFYIKVAEPVERGSMVAVCVDKRVGSVAVERGILKPGRCPGNFEPILKKVYAQKGDTVSVTKDGTYINSRLIPNSTLLTRDSENNEIQSNEARYQLSGDEVFLLSTHVINSWDSRYFGPVKLANIVSVVKPLFVLE